MDFSQGIILHILTSVEKAASVKQALKKVVSSLNGELAETPGQISRMDADVGVGMTGASARVIVVVDESEIVPKRLLWVNEPGGSEESALNRAEEELSKQLRDLTGKVAGFYLEFISPPVPRRTYATIIMAINERVPSEVKGAPTSERRSRLASALRSLGNDSKVINVSRLAEAFGVSRDTIYNDLREIGAER